MKTSDLDLVRDRSLPLPERVAAGARLVESIRTQNEALEVLKDDLRAEVGKRRSPPGAVLFEGEGLTRAIVTVQGATLSLRKGVNPGAYAGQFGRILFPALFEETRAWRVKDNALPVISRLSKRLQATLFLLVEENENKPRVSFQSAGKGVESI